MPRFGTSLRAQNNRWLWSFVVGDAIAIAAAIYPSIDGVSPLAAGLYRAAAAVVVPAFVSLITSLVPSEVKAKLVFWRFRHPLPGHRAFSRYALRDARIDLQALRRNVGAFPERPGEENALWYRLYKKVEEDVTVTLSHGHYLLFRDLAVLSLMLTAAGPAVVWVSGGAGPAIWFVFGLFVVQYLLAAVAARNQGVRLVSNVLALHSLKRRA